MIDPPSLDTAGKCMCTHHIKVEKVMSRFFNKDMNIQNCAQTSAKAVSIHRFIQSSKHKPILELLTEFSAAFIGYETKIVFKRCSK